MEEEEEEGEIRRGDGGERVLTWGKRVSELKIKTEL